MSLINSITSTVASHAVQTAPSESRGIGYAIGRFLGRFIFGTVAEEPEGKERTIVPLNNSVQSFGQLYNTLFPQKTLNLIYTELDPGVDDAMALNLFLAATLSKSNPNIGMRSVNLQAVVAAVGNAVLSQTEQNSLQLLQLAGTPLLPVHPGARAPDAMQNDTQAIEQLEKQINATHRYGRDGLEDVGGWPQATAAIQNMPGHEKIALSVLKATPDSAVTLVSTAGLTDLAQALELLVHFDPDGHFVQNINAIIIRGGCMTPGLECNAPPFKPDDKKDSELSFFFDPPSAQTVFSICQQYQIPVVLLPLALTQQPGLLWTKKQVETLEAINNDVAAQMAKVTKVIPYLDARHFPAGTYPMHDLFAAAALLRPEFFIANRTSVSIGPLGQVVTDSSADVQNVYVLSMPQEQQAAFYDTILKEYENFNCTGEPSAEGCIPPNVWELYLKIGIPVCVGVGGIILLLTICYFRSRRKSQVVSDENSALLQKNQTLQVTVDGMHSVIQLMQSEMGVPEAQEGEEQNSE